MLRLFTLCSRIVAVGTVDEIQAIGGEWQYSRLTLRCAQRALIILKICVNLFGKPFGKCISLVRDPEID